MRKFGTFYVNEDHLYKFASVVDDNEAWKLLGQFVLCQSIYDFAGMEDDTIIADSYKLSPELEEALKAYGVTLLTKQQVLEGE
jgi:hypothetical protein